MSNDVHYIKDKIRNTYKNKLNNLEMNLLQSIALLILFKLSFGQKIISPTNQFSDVRDLKKFQEIKK